MRMLIRHALSIVILPGSAAVAVPMWILGRSGRPVDWPQDPAHVGLALCGVLLIGAGAWLFAASVSHFWSRGRGTLAPWDPPRAFVVSGPYRFVRNPMISGVMFVLFGEALVFRSLPLGIWAATFVLINVVYIPWVEEPALLDRFGEPYARYRNSVPRFVPQPLRRPDQGHLLRHAVATLAYRAEKVLREVPEGFAGFRPSAATRTPLEILVHLGDLMAWAERFARGESRWEAGTPASWVESADRFFNGLAALDAALEDPAAQGLRGEMILQGPVADALTHVGQLAMLRGMVGAPVRPENYARAEISIGRVGRAQSVVRIEF